MHSGLVLGKCSNVHMSALLLDGVKCKKMSSILEVGVQTKGWLGVRSHALHKETDPALIHTGPDSQLVQIKTAPLTTLEIYPLRIWFMMFKLKEG